MKALEEYVAFKYVAWALVVAFAVFVGHLALQAEETIASYSTQDIVYVELQKELIEN